MNGFKTILLYELKEEYRRVAFWIGCIFVAIFTFCDIFPYFLSKLTLESPDFTIYQRLCLRVSEDMALFYYLIIVILCSERIYKDNVLQSSDIIMSLPITKIQYFWGKVTGVFTSFSIIALFSMALVLTSNHFFNPLKIDIIYFILYYLISTEFIIAFAVIVSTTLTIMTKSYKISTLLCLVLFVFSVLLNPKDNTALFIIFNGKYWMFFKQLQNSSDKVLIEGLLNIAVILLYMLTLLVLTHIKIIKDRDRIL